jgi:hypothetical protein
LSTKALTGRKVRGWEALSGYDPDIVYHLGKKNPTGGPSRGLDYMLGGALKRRPGKMLVEC